MAMAFDGGPPPPYSSGILGDAGDPTDDAALDDRERALFAEAGALVEENRRLIEALKQTSERARRVTGQLIDGRQGP